MQESIVIIAENKMEPRTYFNFTMVNHALTIILLLTIGHEDNYKIKHNNATCFEKNIYAGMLFRIVLASTFLFGTRT